MATSRTIARAVGILIVVFAASQLIRPARTNPPTDTSKALDAVEHPPADVAAMLDRSCSDCHANRTRWPWYTNVAPLSWWIINHVNEGRRRVSFSNWAQYDAQKRVKELDEICKRVDRHDMPLESYLLVHRDAALSDAERSRICDWTRKASGQ